MVEVHTGFYSKLDEPIIRLEAANGVQNFALDLLVDTGVNLDLTCTLSLAESLNWQIQPGIEKVQLANNATAKMRRARAYVHWMGQLCQFEVMAFVPSDEVGDLDEDKTRKNKSKLHGSLGMGKLKKTDISFGDSEFTIRARKG